RQRASARLKELGPRVRPLLRRALDTSDEEVKDRLQDLLRGDDPGPARRAAAVRLLREKAPEGAAQVLLDFLPTADDALEDEALPGVAQRAEDLLFAAAGPRGPRPGAASAAGRRAAWAAWWRPGPRLDLGRPDCELPPLNPTLRQRDAARRFLAAVAAADAEA